MTVSIDTAAIQRLREYGGENLLREMLQIFLEDAPQRVEEVRRGVEGADQEAARRAAHALKSSCGNVGANTLQWLCADAEQRARRAELEPAQVVELQSEMQRVKHYLLQQMEGL